MHSHGRIRDYGIYATPTLYGHLYKFMLADSRAPAAAAAAKGM